MSNEDILKELYTISGRVHELIGMIEDHGLEEQENVPCMSVADGEFVIENLERNPGLFRIAKLEGYTLTVFCQEDNLLALREFLECENVVEGRTFRDDAWFGGFPPRLVVGGEYVFDFQTLLPMPNSQNIAINYTNVTGDTHGFFKRID